MAREKRDPFETCSNGQEFTYVLDFLGVYVDAKTQKFLRLNIDRVIYEAWKEGYNEGYDEGTGSVDDYSS